MCVVWVFLHHKNVNYVFSGGYDLKWRICGLQVPGGTQEGISMVQAINLQAWLNPQLQPVLVSLLDGGKANNQPVDKTDSSWFQPRLKSLRASFSELQMLICSRYWFSWSYLSMGCLHEHLHYWVIYTMLVNDSLEHLQDINWEQTPPFSDRHS